MEDLVPMEDKIEWEVHKLRTNRSRGPYRMREEYLQGWLMEAQKAEATAESTSETEGETKGGSKTVMETDMEAVDTEVDDKTETATTDMLHWNKVVVLVQTAIQEGRMAEEATWKEVVLIPKGGGCYRGIGLVEVAWKLETVILNHGFTESTAFQCVLHGFLAVCSTGTTSLMEKCFSS